MTPQGALMQWVNTQHISTHQLAKCPKPNFRTASVALLLCEAQTQFPKLLGDVLSLDTGHSRVKVVSVNFKDVP